MTEPVEDAGADPKLHSSHNSLNSSGYGQENAPGVCDVRDDLYMVIKDHFTRTGQGRKLKLPQPLHLTNLLLAQLCLLKDEGYAATWPDVHVWFSKHFPEPRLSVSQLQHRCQGVTKHAAGLRDASSFLRSELDLFSWYPKELEDLGLSRAILLDIENSNYSPPVNFTPTKSLIAALETVRSKEGLPASCINKWMQVLLKKCGILASKSKVMYRYTVTIKNIKKKKDADLQQFLAEPLFDCLIETPRSKITVRAEEVDALKKDNAVSKKLLLKSEERLKQSLSSVAIEQTKNVALTEVIGKIKHKDVVSACTQTKNVTQRTKGTQSDDIRYDTILEHSKSLTYQLDNERAVNSSIRADIEKLNKQLEDRKNIVIQLKKLLKSEQTKKSNLKTKLEDTKITFQSIVEVEDECSSIKNNSTAINLKCPGNSNNAYSDDVRLAFMALTGEANVAASKCSQIINIVSKYLYKKEIPLNDLPNNQTALNMVSEGQFLSKTQVVESILENEHFMLATDETSRQKRKYLEQHIVLSNGCTMSLGFSEIESETADTLLQKSISVFEGLCEIYVAGHEEILRDGLFKEILSKMKCLMSDRASVMKAFDKKMAQYKRDVLGCDCSTYFLFCNAHFLLGLASASETVLKEIESELPEKLGRDASSKFFRFSNATETAALRVIRATADILGPRGDEKNGCRAEWLTYVEEALNVKSRFTSYRSNRFNNIFENASALLYHSEHIASFLTEYVSHDNLKLQSVLEDIKDPNVMAMVCALAKTNELITSPYWMLVNSNKSYGEFPFYVRTLAQFLDALLDNYDATYNDVPVFPEFTSKFCSIDVTTMKMDMQCYLKTFRAICTKFNEVLKRQLNDFIEDGVFAGDIDEEVKKVLLTCPMSNLTGERLFGDLDYDMSKRRRASLHLRTSINMWKHNKTGKWLLRKKMRDTSRLLLLARKEGKNIKQRSREEERNVKKLIMEKLLENQRKIHEKEIKEREKHLSVVNAVLSHGGVCSTKEDVDELMEGGNRVEALKAQLRYRKLCLQEKHLTLSGNYHQLYETLVSSLGGLPNKKHKSS